MAPKVRNEFPVTDAELDSSNSSAQRIISHILDISTQLLEEEGLDRFNANLLAERASLEIETIYRYFPNRLAILSALVQRWANILIKEMIILGEFSDPRREWREITCSVIDSYGALARSQPGFKAIREAMQVAPELREIEQKLVQELSSIMVEAFYERKVQASKEHLIILARVFLTTIFTVHDLALFNENRDTTLEAKIYEELILMLTSYLSNYLDWF